MPPAFNLSQDQTLQFNLCKLHPPESLPVSAKLITDLNMLRLEPKPKAKHTRVLSNEHFKHFSAAPPEITPRQHHPLQVPTLIGCRLLKNDPVQKQGTAIIVMAAKPSQ